MIELQLLKALSVKENYNKYESILNKKTMSFQSLILLKDYEAYFDEYTEHELIDFNLFPTFFFNSRHPYVDDKFITEYKEIIQQLSNIKTDGPDIESVLTAFNKQEFYNELQQKLDKNISVEKLQEEVNNFKTKKIDININARKVDMDLNNILKKTNRLNGLSWRCDSINNHLQPLIKSDFGLICAYTETGKTSFISSEVSHMAQFLKDDEYILWFNSEGEGARIANRIYCATLNCTQDDLNRYKEKAMLKYIKLMHGKIDRIEIQDCLGLHIKDVEKICKDKPPSLIIFDLLDHIKGFEKYINNEGGSHERYSQLYQWALQLSTQYCPIIATSQLNRNGFNCSYPELVDIRGSGVDKQAAATFVLFIGAKVGQPDIRYLSTPKCKIGDNKNWTSIVKFDPQRSRFI